ncbi:MAG: hypothetical protein GC152_06085 [Alphaproteobacteria bacterium]|nr:hypothetical protein [Alphaproteobacteria bacterium]
MDFQSDDDLKRIADGIRDRTLPKAEWTHAAHFAAAVWLLSEPGCDPFAEMPGIIRAYNEATGVVNSDTDGYHETITRASLSAAKAWIDVLPDDMPLHERLNRLLVSDLGRSDWLFAYWSRELLFSPRARREWVAPDLAQPPF